MYAGKGTAWIFLLSIALYGQRMPTFKSQVYITSSCEAGRGAFWGSGLYKYRLVLKQLQTFGESRGLFSSPVSEWKN